MQIRKLLRRPRSFSQTIEGKRSPDSHVSLVSQSSTPMVILFLTKRSLATKRRIKPLLKETLELLRRLRTNQRARGQNVRTEEVAEVAAVVLTVLSVTTTTLKERVSSSRNRTHKSLMAARLTVLCTAK